MERPVGVTEYFKKKVLILGDGAVGKTSLIRRFVVDKFSDEYITTIGTKTTKKDVVLNVGDTEWNLSLMVWDVLGQKGYSEVQNSAFRGARGVILVYDVSRPETRGSLVDYWIPRLWKVVGRLPMVIFANKIDLSPNAEVERIQLDMMGELYQCPTYATSARTGVGVEEAFRALAGELIVTTETGSGPMLQVLVAGEVDDSLVAVTDRVIMDFCKEFGDVESAMPIVKKQFTKAALDVKRPTKDALLRAMDFLSEVESGFKPPEVVSENRARRLGWVRKAN
jgi:small GTP-binding protein